MIQAPLRPGLPTREMIIDRPIALSTCGPREAPPAATAIIDWRGIGPVDNSARASDDAVGRGGWGESDSPRGYRVLPHFLGAGRTGI